MLVLSRKPNQTIRFPNLGINVEILRVAGNTVRVGIDAPSDVRILRGELPDCDPVEPNDGAAIESHRKWQHDLRNKLNTATLAMDVLQKLLDAGRVADAEKTLAIALSSFAELDRVASQKFTPTTIVKAVADASVETRRALVVEDCANERELLAGYLRLCGYEVDTVEDGEAAMQYLAEHDRPDVVLLDMNMPRMDGSHTVAAIRSNPAYRGMKVFAISGSDRETLQVPLGDRGIDRWFQKPLQPNHFAHQLAEELDCEIALRN